MSALPTGDIVVKVADASSIGEARRAALAAATRARCDETSAGKIAIVATEMASNLAKHAREGLLIVTVRDGVELLALDKGPGIANVGQALRDGFSTGGTAGEGLGSIQRQATTFDLQTVPGVGTIMHATFVPAVERTLTLGAISVPFGSEKVCGDAWAVEHRSGGGRLMVVDGLGHGHGAAEATRVALDRFAARPGLGPRETIEMLHESMRGTRGGAVGVADIDRVRGVLRFAGVGNIAGTILHAGSSRSVVSHGGIVGSECRKVQELDYPFPKGATFVAASDGLQTQWKLDRYPGLLLRTPMIVAGALYRDWSRGRDDTTVVVVRAP